jgi:hypothetical protein
MDRSWCEFAGGGGGRGEGGQGRRRKEKGKKTKKGAQKIKRKANWTES